MAKQLQMNWSFLKAADSLKWELPAGYRLRNFENGDAAAYISLMQAAGFDTWGQNQLNSVFENGIADGIYFVEYLKTREIVATSSGQAKPTAEFPSGGELGWVACHPLHRGNGLGYAVCAALTKRFLELSYSQIYLSTDDFRLPAIKIYLNLGYLPFCSTPDMPNRWEEVLKNLNLDASNYAVFPANES